MTTTSRDLLYDPYDPATILSPHALFRRMRDEAPLYYSEQYNFYAISRFAEPVIALPRVRSGVMPDLGGLFGS